MTAWDLTRGKSAEITKVNLSGAAAERLTALGFVRGAKVLSGGRSLMDSSILLMYGAVRLAARRCVAELIEVAQ